MRQWYVRRRGLVSGPFTPDELRDMRDNGSLGRFDEVSRDQRDWHPVADLGALTRAAERPAEPDPEPDPEPEPPRRSRWPAALVVAVVLILLGAVAVAVLLFLNQNARNEGAAAETRRAPAAAQ